MATRRAISELKTNTGMGMVSADPPHYGHSTEGPWGELIINKEHKKGQGPAGVVRKGLSSSSALLQAACGRSSQIYPEHHI